MNQNVLAYKQGVVTEIQNKYQDSSSTVVAEYRGLSVAEITELRRSLRAEGVEMKVYKNTLASIAADAAGFSDLKNALTGPNALAFGSDETTAARIMATFAKKHKALVLKGGIVEGKVVDEATIIFAKDVFFDEDKKQYLKDNVKVLSGQMELELEYIYSDAYRQSQYFYYAYFDNSHLSDYYPSDHV